MPSDLRPTEGLNYKSNPNPGKLHKATLLSPRTAAAPAFGWQARVVSLLDRLLAALRHTDAGTEAKLTVLDGEIQDYLKAVLGQWNWSRNVHCVPASICVR